MGRWIAIFVTIALPALLFCSASVYAMPNFASQGDVSCFTCHFAPVDEPDSKLAISDNAVSLLSPSQKGNVSAGLSVYSTGSDAASQGFNDRPISDLFLTQDDNFGRGLNGVSGYLGNNSFNAGMSLITTGQTGVSPLNTSQPLSVWYRLAYTPKLGDIDMAIGLFGESSTTDGPAYYVKSQDISEQDSVGLDAKIRGDIGGVTLNLKAMYVSSISSPPQLAPIATGRTTATSEDLLETGRILEGYGAAARLDIKKAFGVSAAYRTYKKAGSAEDKISLASIGAWINIADGLTIESQFTTSGTDNSLTSEDSAFTLLLITEF